MTDRQIGRKAWWLVLNEPRLRWHVWRAARCREALLRHQLRLADAREEALGLWPDMESDG